MGIWHSKRSMSLCTTLTAFTLLSACGSSATPETVTPAEPVAYVEEAPEAYTPPVTEGEIARTDLNQVLDGGLGRFLQGVGTEPHFDASRNFVGFRLTHLYPDDPRFQTLDLHPGDVVTHINGVQIERPEHAMQVWDALRVSSELVVHYQREGEARDLRFAIVD